MPATSPSAFSSGTFPFSKFGGHLSAVERAFDLRHAGPPAQPGDRTARRHKIFLDRADAAPAGGAVPQAQPRFAIGLGCEIRHAARLVYASGVDLEKAEGTPIGVNCRLCERENCSQRAEPPITRTLILDENTRDALEEGEGTPLIASHLPRVAEANDETAACSRPKSACA